MEYSKEIAKIECTEHIMTAEEVALKILEIHGYKLDEFIFNKAFIKYKKSFFAPWQYLIGEKEMDFEKRLNFYKQFIPKEEFISLSNSYITDIAIKPNKEILQNGKCPDDILEKVNKAISIYEDCVKDFNEQRKIIRFQWNIIDCLKVLALKKKITINGEWQGKKTEISYSDWEDLYNLIIKNNINPISKEDEREYTKKIEELSQISKKEAKELQTYLFSRQGMSREEIAKKLGFSTVSGSLSNISARVTRGKNLAIKYNLPDLEEK